MARYVNENGGSIEAHQWFRNGDHPGDLVGMLVDDPMGGKYEKIEGAVVQFFQHPDHDGEDRCNNCGRKWSDHGWIDQGGFLPAAWQATVGAGPIAGCDANGERVGLSAAEVGGE